MAPCSSASDNVRVSFRELSATNSVLYEQSRNIDANLAEIDMENFRSEDIHAILAGGHSSGHEMWDSGDEMACSVTDSMIRELVASNCE